jgi:hypothetical protein
VLALILLLAIAWTCAKAIDSASGAVSDQHKKRIAKAAKKKGKTAGVKAAAWAATGVTAAGTFLKGFTRGWKREWPKARKRAAERFDKTPKTEASDPAAPQAEPEHRPAETDSTPPAQQGPAPTSPPTLVLIKKSSSAQTGPEPETAGGNPMALATIPEITGVNTLKSAVARFASEANVTAEEAGAMAQRAAEQLAAIEAAIDQAGALEFGDDGGTLQELAALRDQYAAALGAAQALQKAAVDNAAIASQSSKNIHDRHGGIQEAVAARGGRMASKAAYTQDA